MRSPSAICCRQRSIRTKWRHGFTCTSAPGYQPKRRQSDTEIGLMASLTKQQLTAIEKSMVAIIDDPEKSDEIKKTFSEFRKALGEGTAVTADDVDARLEVLLEPVAKGNEGGGSGDVEMPEDPMAPIFDQLYRQLEPMAKKAGGADTTLQGMFQKAYAASRGELDNIIGATTEAVAIELGAGEQVQFGKVAREAARAAAS